MGLIRCARNLQVYVTVYADGPTRVLCFSEDRSGVFNMDDENSLMNLSYRLQQVRRCHGVNRIGTLVVRWD